VTAYPAIHPGVVPTKVRPPEFSGFPRERLDRLLRQAWGVRLTTLVAPAGSGKTTLLARFAATAPYPVAWYRAEPWDTTEEILVRHLESACRPFSPVVGPWYSVGDVARGLDDWPRPGLALVIDDGHALEGTAAQDALKCLVAYLPSQVHVVVASRRVPDLDLPRWRLAGDLLEIGADDLRFRTWETEELFRDYYRLPLPPIDLAAVNRWMEGWAAGLQLFHLAARSQSPEERRRLLQGPAANARLIREYLARHVLAGLPTDLHRFLVDSSPLELLSGPLCDAYLGRRGSGTILESLVQRGLFTETLTEAPATYRYHEVLRSHLLSTLVEEVGEDTVRGHHARAAALLLEHGATAEALVSYCRAGEWGAVRALLDAHQPELSASPDRWLPFLPPAISRHDPWIALASARQAVRAGRWHEAQLEYARAEEGFGVTAAGTTARQERMELASWLERMPRPGGGWTALLRSGLQGDPLAAAGQVGDQEHALLLRGLLLVVAGRWTAARDHLEAAQDAGPLDAAVARIVLAVIGLAIGEPRGPLELEAALAGAERAGFAWIARLGRDVGRHLLADPEVGERDEAQANRAEDPWQAGLVALTRAWSSLRGLRGETLLSSEPPPTGAASALEAAWRAARSFDELGAGALGAWANSLAAVAASRARQPGGLVQAVEAERQARRRGVSGARLLAALARSLAAGEMADAGGEILDGLMKELGLHLAPGPTVVGGQVTGQRGPEATLGPREALASVHPVRGVGRAVPRARRESGNLWVVTMGGFAIEVDGRPLDLAPLRPRARSLLRRLSVQPGMAVHREILQEDLWPDLDGEAGRHRLQVAVSAVRTLLRCALGERSGELLVRDGEAYRLAVPATAVDLGRLRRAMEAAESAERQGRDQRPVLEEVLDLYRGELLPEEGPAEWVVEARRELTEQVLACACRLATLELDAGDPSAATRAARCGLAVDRFHDPLWRLLITAQERAGQPGAAARSRREYGAILAELGVA
jgi:serine/threonine-protein kinase PknK